MVSVQNSGIENLIKQRQVIKSQLRPDVYLSRYHINNKGKSLKSDHLILSEVSLRAVFKEKIWTYLAG